MVWVCDARRASHRPAGETGAARGSPGNSRVLSAYCRSFTQNLRYTAYLFSFATHPSLQEAACTMMKNSVIRFAGAAALATGMLMAQTTTAPTTTTGLPAWLQNKIDRAAIVLDLDATQKGKQRRDAGPVDPSESQIQPCRHAKAHHVRRLVRRNTKAGPGAGSPDRSTDRDQSDGHAASLERTASGTAAKGASIARVRVRRPCTPRHGPVGRLIGRPSRPSQKPFTHAAPAVD
jgi:hypothetical protein